MEVGIGPGDVVLDGEPAPPRKGAQQPPLFGPIALARSPISAAEHLLRYASRQTYTETDISFNRDRQTDRQTDTLIAIQCPAVICRQYSKHTM